MDIDDGESDTNDTHNIKHSPFINENQFINLMSSNTGLSLFDLNVCNAFSKYDELVLFNNRVNKNNLISVICLNECWFSYKSKVNKFIVLEINNEASINNFCNELGSLNIYDHLDKRLKLDPNDKYELFAGFIKYAREKHLPKIKVKYNIKNNIVFLNGLQMITCNPVSRLFTQTN